MGRVMGFFCLFPRLFCPKTIATFVPNDDNDDDNDAVWWSYWGAAVTAVVGGLILVVETEKKKILYSQQSLNISYFWERIKKIFFFNTNLQSTSI